MVELKWMVPLWQGPDVGPFKGEGGGCVWVEDRCFRDKVG